MSSHRGTRNSRAIGGNTGTVTMLDRAYKQCAALDNLKTYGTSNHFSQQTFRRQTFRINAAIHSGVAFSMFPEYTKATDLKTGTVAFGRDHYSALLALWADGSIKARDYKIIKLQRDAILREAARG